MKQKLLLLFVVAVLAVVAVPALAAADICQVGGNLIRNCGFETGNFQSWSQSGNMEYTFVAGGPFAFSGNYGAQLGPIGSDGYLTQTVKGNTFSFQFREDPSLWGLDSVYVADIASCGHNCDLYHVSFYLENLDRGMGTTPNDFTVLWNGADVGPSLIDYPAFAWTQFSLNLTGVSTPEPGGLLLLGSGILGAAGLVRRNLSL